MNSRERVLAAIHHQESMEIPLDLGSNPSSGISAIAYSKLLRHLGKEHLSVRIYDVVQQLAQPHAEILDLIGADVLDIGRAFNEGAEDWHATILSNAYPAYYPEWFRPEQEASGAWIANHTSGIPIAKMPVGASFFDQTFFPWIDGYPVSMDNLDDAMSKVLWSAFVHSPWDRIDQEGFWEDLRMKALQLRQGADKALMVVAGCNLFEWGTFIRRMDQFLMDLHLEPGNVDRLMDALMQRHLSFLKRICESVGDVVDVIRFGDDLGTMTGPIMSPETYRRFFKPRHKILCDFVHKNSGMHTFLHSCGSIYALIPDLIEAGFEILNPVQTQCKDMEPEKLKNEFGKELTFWGGGIETAGTLNNESPEKVRQEVLQRLDVLSRDGGFVFNTIHNILPDVPPENIVAMYNAVLEYRGEALICV